MKRVGDPLEDTVKKKRAFKSRSEVDKAEDERIFNEITTNGEKILPSGIFKYKGSVYKAKNTDTWQSVFQNQFKYVGTMSHRTMEEAEARVKTMNVEHNLPIKNIVYLYEDEYYCTLTQNQLMKFSFHNMDIVQRFSWCADFKRADNTFYARSNSRKVSTKNQYFHSLVCPHPEGLSTDHISRKTLDNTIPNLRVASNRTQCLNQKMKSNNTTGVRGVQYDKHRNAYITAWTNEEGVYCVKYFSGLELGKEEAFRLAVAHRKDMENTVEFYRIALNNI